jgi:selenium metabolism protein YedF
MEGKLVDARGLACPQPVLQTRRALRAREELRARKELRGREGQAAGGELTVIVDNDTAQKNVTRMAEKSGYVVQAERKDDGIYLRIGGQGAQGPAVETQEMAVGKAIPAEGPLVLFVASEHMGQGEHAELGNILIRAFFHTLGEVEPLPETIIFINSGIKLVTEGSPVVEDLEALCSQGIEVLACGTCLDYYGLKDKLAVGEISNMYTIAETLLGAGKVVKP